MMNAEVPIMLSSQCQGRYSNGWSKNPLHDHNYAAKPPDRNMLTPLSLSSQSHFDLKDDDPSTQSLRDEISRLLSSLDKCKGEISQKSKQLADAAVKLLEYQHKLAAKEVDLSKLTKDLEQERLKKTELQITLDKFRTSAANICCGVTLSIDEFKRQLKVWCLTHEVGEPDRKLFHSKLCSISGVVQDSLKAWVETNLITQIELDKAREAITELAKLSKPRTWSEEVNKINLATCSTQVVVVKPTGESESVQLGSLEESQQQQADKIDKVITPGKNGIVKVKGHQFAKDDGKRFKCVCGVSCKKKSGLKLHIRSASAIPTAVTTENDKSDRKISVLEPSNCKKIKIKNNHSERIPTEKELPSLDLPAQPVSKIALSFNSFSPVINSDQPCSSNGPTATPDEPNSVVSEECRTVVSKRLQKSPKFRNFKSRLSHKVNPANQLQCQCGYKALRPSIIKSHIKYYKSDRKFACKHCPKLFLNLNYLNRHQKTTHEKAEMTPLVRGPRKKTQNGRIAISSLTKTEYKKLPKPVEAVRARTISKKRRNAAKRKRKLLRITAKERISCQHCHRRFPHIRDLIKHMARKMHGGEALTSRYQLDKPRSKSSTKNDRKSSESSSTGKSDSSIRTPRRSTRVVNEADKIRRLYDDYCFTFKTKVRRGRKELLCDCGHHCGKKKYGRRGVPPNCALCGNIFACVEHLERHVREMHNISCHVPKICKKCGATFETAKQRVEHSKTLHIDPAKSGKEKVNGRRHTKISGKKKRKAVSKASSSSVVHHRLLKRRGKASSLKCSCGKLYSSMKYLSKHIKEQRFGKI